MEALSDLLRLMQLQVSIYHNAKVCGDWQINEHLIGQTCFHMATEGGCILDIPNLGSYSLHCGDLVIFPRELPHSMKPFESDGGPQQHLEYHSDLPGTGMLCGRAIFEHRASEQLLNALPQVVFVRNSDKTPWLIGLLELIRYESYQQGAASQVILDKLSETLFTYALRHQLNEHPADSGVLALYAHSKLSLAVNAIHAKPDEAWTLQSLAKVANQSRTVFSESFRKISGWTAMRYLTWWRMQLAWSYLVKGEPVALVAEKVGYQSESAFSRVFQKEFATSAGSVRRNAS